MVEDTDAKQEEQVSGGCWLLGWACLGACLGGRRRRRRRAMRMRVMAQRRRVGADAVG
jgi:hypothetical protein